MKKFSRGDVIEVVDDNQEDNPYKHDWKVVSVGSNKPLDQEMKQRQNTTEIKISTWAAMKVATHFSANIDELKVNTYSVLELHKQICDTTANEDGLF